MALFIDLGSPALIASIVAACVATLGLLAVWWNKSFADKYSGYFSAFAAGVLVMTGLRLIAEGLEMTPFAPYWVMGGYLFLYMINSLLRHDPASGMAIAPPLIGIGLHSFLDGLEYGILFDHDIFIGMMASAGLILHEFAEGMILFTLLRAAGMRPPLAIVAAFFGAALTTPLGAVLSLEYLHLAPPELLGILVSLAAGALLYVGATHLTVHISNINRFVSVIIYVLGVLVAMALSFVHQDMYEGENGHNHFHAAEEDSELHEDPYED